MSFHRCASLVLVFAVSACASSSSGGPFSDEFETATAADANRGNSTLIVRAELAELSGESAYRAIELLRRRWLMPRRGNPFPGVVINQISRTNIGQLRGMSVDSIESMRFLSGPEATTRYGTGYSGGVIEVMERGRPGGE